MDKESLELTNGIGHAVIKLRGLYSAWSGAHGISYHGMIVLCTIKGARLLHAETCLRELSSAFSVPGCSPGASGQRFCNQAET